MIWIEGIADAGAEPAASRNILIIIINVLLEGATQFRRGELEKGNLSGRRLPQQRKLINANSNEWFNLGEYSFEGNLEAGLAVA